MAYVSENIIMNGSRITLRYDESKVFVDNGIVNSTRVKPVQGFEMQNNVNIVIERSGRDNLTVEKIDDTPFIGSHFTRGSLENHFIEFEINLGTSSGMVLTVNTDNANFTDISEPTYEIKTNGENAEVNFKVEKPSPEPLPIYETVESVRIGESVNLEKDDYLIEIKPDSGYLLESAFLNLIENSPNPNAQEEFINGQIEILSTWFDFYDSFEIEIDTKIEEIEPNNIDISYSGNNYNIIFINRETNEEFSNPVQIDRNYNYDVYISIDSNYEMIFSEIIERRSPESDIYSSFENNYIELNLSSMSRGLEFRITTESIDTSKPTKGIFNNIYLVNNSKLIEINRQWIADEFVNVEMPSLAPYVIGLLELPFKINSEIETTNVKIGNHEYDNISAETLKIDNYKMSLGKIAVPLKYENIYDYINTDIFLHLPYSETIKLETEYVINETIEIEYIINLYDGTSTMNLKTSKIDDIFFSKTFNIGSQIPFFNKQSDTILNNNDFKIPLNNHLKKAYIEVVRNVPYNTNNEFTNNVNYKGLIGDETGYLEIDNIILNGDMTSNDRVNIKNILRNGVFING